MAADDSPKVLPDDIRQRALSFLRVRQAILTPKSNPPASPNPSEDTQADATHGESVEEFRKREREKE
jgi:hypothetical protein